MTSVIRLFAIIAVTFSATFATMWFIDIMTSGPPPMRTVDVYISAPKHDVPKHIQDTTQVALVPPQGDDINYRLVVSGQWWNQKPQVPDYIANKTIEIMATAHNYYAPAGWLAQFPNLLTLVVCDANTCVRYGEDYMMLGE